jgi:nitrate/nitrite transport system ATP-binding protein
MNTLKAEKYTLEEVNPELEFYSKENVKLNCINLTKSYPTPKGQYVVLEGLNMEIYKEEFVSIIGHSGCGKSTVLSMIAGLNPVTKGSINLDNSEIKGPGPDRAVVFQSPSLFPWMTALENVMLGVKRVFPHAGKKERESICKYYLDKVGLANSFYKKAGEMSNGMKQRVGIARAFALKPEILLLDEPFGMLDSLTRAELQEVLMEIWSKEKITAIMVTHDVDEAIYLSDRIIMMTSGPYAKVGDTLHIDIPRPRIKSDVIEFPAYYRYREHLIRFLEG